MMSDPASILVIRRDNIGDLVCTTPLLTALREHFPGARLDVLANSYNAPVLSGNSDIDEVHVYRKLKHLHSGGGAISALAERVDLLWRLRRRKLDLILLPAGQQDVRGARLAGFLAPSRIICADRAVEGQHEVERTFSAVRPLGIRGPIPPVRVVPGAASLGRVREAIGRAGLESMRPLVGMHISARRIAQRWPAEHFARLSIALWKEHGAAAILFWSPGPEDHPQHPGDDAKARAILNLAGSKASLIPWATTELPDLIGGLAACDAVICSDGGAMHIAAGLGKPILCFFGDSPVARWRPWGVPHVLLQASSRKVEDISLAEAVSAVSTLLSTQPAP